MDLNTGLQMLLQKYSVEKNGEITPDGFLAVDGKKLPLLPWRQERRFIECKNLVNSPYTVGISTMRVCHIAPQSTSLFDLLYREADLCQWILNTNICEIFAIGNEKALNVSALTEKGYALTFELAATLQEGEPAVDKHEIIAQKGVICDRVVDTQMPQSSVYVLGNNGTQTYTDVDAELFGLSIRECALVRAAFDCLKNGYDLTEADALLRRITDAAGRSCRTLENIKL